MGRGRVLNLPQRVHPDAERSSTDGVTMSQKTTNGWLPVGSIMYGPDRDDVFPAKISLQLRPAGRAHPDATADQTRASLQVVTTVVETPVTDCARKPSWQRYCTVDPTG